MYTPEANFVGADSFKYIASDGLADSDPVTVTIHVTNADPIAQSDVYHVDAVTGVTVDMDLGVLANDTDADDMPVAGVLVDPLYGVVTLEDDGSFLYTPGPGFIDADTFTYLITDAVGATAQATVYLTAGVAARDDAYRVNHAEILEVSADDGVLMNDDVLAAATTVTKLADPSHGTVTLNADGSFTYVYTGTAQNAEDQFTYEIDVAGSFKTATVRITIYNVAPVGYDDAYDVELNTPLTVNAASGVFANDFDQEGDNLSLTLVQAPLNGIIEFGSGGSFTYTPNEGFEGTETILYQLSDGAAIQAFPIALLLTVGQPALARVITVSGRITYDPGTGPLPVRWAVVQLLAADNRRVLATTETDATGNYTLRVSTPADFRTIICVYAKTAGGGIGDMPRVSVNDNSLFEYVYWTYHRRGPVVANIFNENFTIATDTRPGKAFATFDAGVTALNTISNLIGLPRGASMQIHYRSGPIVSGTSYTPSAGQIRLWHEHWKNWDIIVHEFGHVVQYLFDVYPFGDFEATALFRMLSHDEEINNRVAHNRLPSSVALRLGFSEGFASFFSMYAQEADTTAPTLVFAEGQSSKDMKLGRFTIEDHQVGISAGEDEELTVMRVLWDLFDNVNTASTPAGIGDYGADFINLGFQGLFDIIINRNPPAGSGSQTSTTLSDLWNNIKRRNPENAANRELLTKFGSVFEMNNVSPWAGGLVFDLGGSGMYIDGNWAAEWSHTADAGKIPEFWFEIPAGMPDQPTTAQLLDTFEIRFFNADWTVAFSFNTNLVVSGNLVKWTPTIAQWNDIKARRELWHWVVEGGWHTTGELTGRYWSGVHDISITA